MFSSISFRRLDCLGYVAVAVKLAKRQISGRSNIHNYSGAMTIIVRT